MEAPTNRERKSPTPEGGSYGYGLTRGRRRGGGLGKREVSGEWRAAWLQLGKSRFLALLGMTIRGGLGWG